MIFAPFCRQLLLFDSVVIRLKLSLLTAEHCRRTERVHEIWEKEDQSGKKFCIYDHYETMSGLMAIYMRLFEGRKFPVFISCCVLRDPAIAFEAFQKALALL